MRAPRFSTVLGAGVVAWGLAVGLVRLHDNSFLTELATGRLIVAHGFPHADPYSFTAHGHPWVLESWLASVLYAEVDRAGAHGLQLLHAGLAALLAAIVWRLTRPAVTLLGRVLAAGAALVVGTGYWTPRPLLIALIALGVVVILTEQESGSVWWLVPVMWIWVQVHGSWPFAIGYVVVRMVGRAVDRRPLGRLPGVLGAVVAGIVVGAANPYGFRLLGYPLVVLTRHQAFTHIVEWQSPNFSDPVDAVFLAAALLALVVAGVRRAPLEDGLVTVVFVAAACLASRNVPVASLVITPVLARSLQGLGSLDGARRSAATLLATAAMVAIGAALVSGALHKPEFDLRAYPQRAVTWMQEHRLAPGRVATQDLVGNYLEYRYGARASAFVDDRYDMYPLAVTKAYETLLGGGPSWQAILRRYRVRTVLWAGDQPLASLVSADPRWHVVYRDRRWIVATEASPAAGTG